MPSLRQVVADHAPLLVIDAASARIQVGVLGGTGGARWSGSDEEAGTGIFRCVESLGVDLPAIRSFAFADGPGSVLGIRTAAMALRLWCALEPRPVFAYHALALVAEAEGRAEVGYIADARRDSWHFLRRGETVRRVPTAELSGPLAMPEGFRHWTPLPAGVERVSYSLEDLLPRTAAADLFRPTDSPDAFLFAEPRYATWTPQVHRSP